MRIIAGQFRGRKLKAPPGLTTRPTTDRVREAWFSILGPLDGTVLDLYAGTGALGFEALSRGAARAVFVEADKHAQKAITDNADALGVRDRIILISSLVERCHAAVKKSGPYTLVLTDPPWTALEDAGRALKRLLTAELLTEDGRLALGHPKKQAILLPETSGLVAEKERNWGDSAATFYVRKPEEGSL